MPLLKKKIPESLRYIAAGLPGGSQCHGHDDEISRDHGWGPGFIIWIRSDMFESLSPELAIILKDLPDEFNNFKTLKYGAVDFDGYVKSVTGVKYAPSETFKWMNIPEECLFEITHRPVFLDETGFAKDRFAGFTAYPDDIWKKRLGACLLHMWEWGVKGLKRAEQRNDMLTTSMYWSKFAEYAAKVLFLLNHSYAPYHKWLFRLCGELKHFVPDIMPLIEKGYQSESGKYDIAREICLRIIEALKKSGFHPAEKKTHNKTVYPDMIEICRYAYGILSTINDENLKRMNPYQEVDVPPTKPTFTYVC